MKERRLAAAITVASLMFSGCRADKELQTREPARTSTVPAITESTQAATATAREISTITPTIEPPTPSATETVTQVPIISIAVTGDVMLGRYVHVVSLQHNELTWPLQKIRNFLVDQDIVLINLENPFADPCRKETRSMVFCAPPEAVAALTYAGIDVANTANNHVLDHGIEGEKLTFQTLEMAGIQASDEEHLAVIEKEGVKFGFIGFNRVKQNAEYQILTEQEILDRIEESAELVDVLVVSFHWGIEYRTRPNEEQVRLGQAAIDHGARIVVGNHPHVIQPIVEYKGGVVIYALGNTVFDQMWEDGRKGEIVVFQFQRDRMLSYDVLETRIDGALQTNLVEP